MLQPKYDSESVREYLGMDQGYFRVIAARSGHRPNAKTVDIIAIMTAAGYEWDATAGAYRKRPKK